MTTGVELAFAPATAAFAVSGMEFLFPPQAHKVRASDARIITQMIFFKTDRLFSWLNLHRIFFPSLVGKRMNHPSILLPLAGKNRPTVYRLYFTENESQGQQDSEELPGILSYHPVLPPHILLPDEKKPSDFFCLSRRSC